MAAQNFKEEDWGNGDTKLGQNWHKNFQACLYIKYFTQRLNFNQILYKLSEFRHSCKSNSSILSNHLIFNLAFREFRKHFHLGRGCVYTVNSPFKSEVLGYLTGIIYWFFHRGVI